MAVRYYDDVISAKIKKWMPENSNIRVLKPEETKRFFETIADDTNDKPFHLPLIALSRGTDIELLSNVKSQKSYDGLRVYSDIDKTLQMNVIPIHISYQLDIYTKTFAEGDEYLRNFLFKLINNPAIKIEIPYNNTHIEHIANIRVMSNVSDTSSISERLFPGQFTRWSIKFEIQDAFLFSMPYKKNWKLYIDGETIVDPDDMDYFDPADRDPGVNGVLEIWEEPEYINMTDSENLKFYWKKSSKPIV